MIAVRVFAVRNGITIYNYIIKLDDTIAKINSSVRIRGVSLTKVG